MHSAITRSIFAFAVLGAVTLPGVADAQGQTAATASVPAPARPKTNRDIIARTDLDAKPSANLYDLVSSLRSHWLRGSTVVRANMSITDKGSPAQQALFGDPDASPRTGVTAGAGATTLVYVDGRKFGALAALRSMPAETAEKLCYFPINRAQNRFGLSVESPVIEVFTRASSYAETAC